MGQNNIDLLFDKSPNISEWMPQHPPEVLGELLESRYMLPLTLPSDPRMLAAVPGRRPDPEHTPNLNHSSKKSMNGDIRNASRVRSSHRRVLDWVTKGRRLRHIGADMLDCIDGSSGSGRWTRRADADAQDEEATEGVQEPRSVSGDAGSEEDEEHPSHVHLTRLTRATSTRSRQGRGSTS